jgi:hypothetical protein
MKTTITHESDRIIVQTGELKTVFSTAESAADQIVTLHQMIVSPGGEGDYQNPTIETVLRAVPMLQWRRCGECDRISLYRDNMLPACKCEACGSADTRHMLAANQALHRKG